MALGVNFEPNDMRASFDPKPLHVGFLVDKMAMGQDLLQ